MIGSCKNFAIDGAEMIFCRLSRTRAAAARILRRMSESSLLALASCDSISSTAGSLSVNSDFSVKLIFVYSVCFPYVRRSQAHVLVVIQRGKAPRRLAQEIRLRRIAKGVSVHRPPP